MLAHTLAFIGTMASRLQLVHHPDQPTGHRPSRDHFPRPPDCALRVTDSRAHPRDPEPARQSNPCANFSEPVGSVPSDWANEAPIELTDAVSARPLVAQSFFHCCLVILRIVCHFAATNSVILLLWTQSFFYIFSVIFVIFATVNLAILWSCQSFCYTGLAIFWYSAHVS
jgi:hypothetical protein